ncbi:MAG: hypothetical protein K6T88_08060 [Bacillus sp. (in: Bacteria)]|nr:hypothetical protein [Bacillus sp. (in: firmicutes)]
MDNQMEVASSLLNEWGRIDAQLEKSFSERDQKNVTDWMEKGIALFVHFLFLSNEKSLPHIEPIPFHEVDFKPINIVERLGFIISRPNLYHSYRQLAELMNEQEKLLAKRNILKKASKPKG